jgi:hypothetical protein
MALLAREDGRLQAQVVSLYLALLHGLPSVLWHNSLTCKPYRPMWSIRMRVPFMRPKSECRLRINITGMPTLSSNLRQHV